jgi:outer membrane protein OmpA-like peptidoglycan-associated protein
MRKLTALLAPFALALCVACASTDREPRPEETAAAETRPAPAESRPDPAPEPTAEDPAVEASRRAEEEVERMPPVPPPADLPSVLEVRFDSSAAALSAGARSVLDGLAERLLASLDGVQVVLQGHADATGGEAANLRLAELRAEEVRTYLHREKGLPPETMEVVPYGSAVPVADNATADGRALNRRVVIVLLSPP